MKQLIIATYIVLQGNIKLSVAVGDGYKQTVPVKLP